ncbi:hypothetical protein MO973_19965 [Paenibacillus sp. TRM 82003]|nr:hypothetical protein [Paenibacillus sp. TRM 82003]
MTIPQFMSGSWKTEEDRFIDKVVAHLKKHKIVYQIIGTTLIISLAAAPDVSFAATGIDAGGRKIYSKLLSLAKWIIIIKGGWDTINNTVKGDFDSAKRTFFSYLIVYIILLGLPWSLNEIDAVFKDLA